MSASPSAAVGSSKQITFDPRLPADWPELTFPLTVRGSRFRVHLVAEAITFTLEEGEEVEVSGWIERTDGRKLHMVGEVRAGGQLCARATGLWVVLSPEAFAAALAQAGLSAEQFMS